MTKRHRLPAPPLVLDPILVRVENLNVDRLRKLAAFLLRRGHLTDGGRKALEDGLEGRNGFCSLTGQDVRGWAQALALELWGACESNWEAVHQDYFLRFDRGKPRRPSHLQRLYIQWSSDFSWPGLLRRARTHPWLWDDLALAVARLPPEHPERGLLSLALSARSAPGALEAARLKGDVPRSVLFCLARHLPWPAFTRLEFLERAAPGCDLEEAYSLVCACSLPFAEAASLPPLPGLERVAETLLPHCIDHHRAEFFTGFRAFLRKSALLEPLWASLSIGDPLRRVRFGPRPGVEWRLAVDRELRLLIESRLSRPSQ